MELIELPPEGDRIQRLIIFNLKAQLQTTHLDPDRLSKLEEYFNTVCQELIKDDVPIE